jgi:hypothetical protein
MMNAVYYPGDLENGCGILANGSEFDQSSWSYLNASVTTEPWVEEDVFMGSIQDDSLRHDVNPLETVNSESFMDPSLERNLPSDSFADEPSAISMSPYPDPSRRISAFEDEMWASGPGIAEQHKQHSASPHHSLTYSNSNEPWDPIQLRVTLDDRAFVAFVDSPKSSSDQSVCEALLEPNVASRGSTHAPQDTTLEGSLLKSPPAENQQKLQWEFINVAANGPPRNDNSTWRDASRGHSRGRQGPMDKQKAKDAHVMRKNGACWPCRVSKRRASPTPNKSQASCPLTNNLSARWGNLADIVESMNHQYRLYHTKYVADLVSQTSMFCISQVSPVHVSGENNKG